MSINELSARHRYVLKRWAWQPLRYKNGKYDIKWSISSTLIMVCTFSSRNMMANLAHWSLAWFDAYICTVEKKLWICNRKLQDYPNFILIENQLTRVYARAGFTDLNYSEIRRKKLCIFLTGLRTLYVYTTGFNSSLWVRTIWLLSCQKHTYLLPGQSEDQLTV